MKKFFVLCFFGGLFLLQNITQGMIAKRSLVPIRALCNIANSDSHMPVIDTARVALLNSKNQMLLFGYRKDMHVYWYLPGGKINVGEIRLQVAQRELYEETGICPRQVRYTYPHPAWYCEYMMDLRGQKTRFNECIFLARLDGDVSDIKPISPADPENDAQPVWWNMHKFGRFGYTFHPPQLLPHLVNTAYNGGTPMNHPGGTLKIFHADKPLS